ncbi:MAG: CpXC domain-containing protein [Elusimicrobiota bacterium]
MSFRGAIEARCPNGCGPAMTEVWSFVRGDVDEALRDSLLAGELNLLLCERCGQPFYPETTVVYFDARTELVAFVFPESHRKDADRWRRKMREDFAEMRRVLATRMPLKAEPLSFFGFDEIRALLQAEDDLEDEVMVAEFLCRELELAAYQVDRTFARLRHLPRIMPYAGAPPSARGRAFSRDAARSGLDALLKANGRLRAFRRWIEFLKTSTEAPPAASTAPKSPAFRTPARSRARRPAPRRPRR